MIGKILVIDLLILLEFKLIEIFLTSECHDFFNFKENYCNSLKNIDCT